mmetsp:Transcript_3350/g.7907  ORF Transcript_3350/g.7907 Transcript_3350/m.7907 type:complete len:201 (+) Transcript_3350:532-1134(+)
MCQVGQNRFWNVVVVPSRNDSDPTGLQQSPELSNDFVRRWRKHYPKRARDRVKSSLSKSREVLCVCDLGSDLQQTCLFCCLRGLHLRVRTGRSELLCKLLQHGIAEVRSKNFRCRPLLLAMVTECLAQGKGGCTRPGCHVHDLKRPGSVGQQARERPGCCPGELARIRFKGRIALGGLVPGLRGLGRHQDVRIRWDMLGL